MTIGETLRRGAARLADVGVESPQREARLLLAEIIAMPSASLMAWPEIHIDVEVTRRFDAALKRRCAHEPLSRIVGRREFWSLEFAVTKDTLDPRPDTETLIDVALRYFDHFTPLRIADLGTGTGCILLSLLHEFQAATGIGTDLSSGAIETATGNADSLGLAGRCQFILSNWADNLTGSFDLVISNPPYIPRGDIGSLDPAVRVYDPIGALDGGDDGLDAYRALAAAIPSILAPFGYVLLEIGIGQEETVPPIFTRAGFEIVEIRADLAGIPRAVLLRSQK